MVPSLRGASVGSGWTRSHWIRPTKCECQETATDREGRQRSRRSLSAASLIGRVCQPFSSLPVEGWDRLGVSHASLRSRLDLGIDAARIGRTERGAMLLDALDAQQPFAASPGPSFTPRRSNLSAWTPRSIGSYDGRGWAAPAELRPVDPHAVQDHRQLASDGDDGSTVAADLRKPNTPRL